MASVPAITAAGVIGEKSNKVQDWITGFLDNDSMFGRLMTRIGVIVGANLMFILLSIPVITIGAGYTAMLTVMMKALRGDGEVNPFREFWHAFRANWKQSTVSFAALGAAGAFLLLDLRIIRSSEGALSVMYYPVLALLILVLITGLYLFPAMAAFRDTLPHLLRNAVYIAVHRIWTVPILLAAYVFPLLLTYTDRDLMPLYAFCWVTFGFGALAMLSSALLLPVMEPFLAQLESTS